MVRVQAYINAGAVHPNPSRAPWRLGPRPASTPALGCACRCNGQGLFLHESKIRDALSAGRVGENCAHVLVTSHVRECEGNYCEASKSMPLGAGVEKERGVRVAGAAPRAVRTLG